MNSISIGYLSNLIHDSEYNIRGETLEQLRQKSETGVIHKPKKKKLVEVTERPTSQLAYSVFFKVNNWENRGAEKKILFFATQENNRLHKKYVFEGNVFKLVFSNRMRVKGEFGPHGVDFEGLITIQFHDESQLIGTCRQGVLQGEASFQFKEQEQTFHDACINNAFTEALNKAKIEAADIHEYLV
ncbi:MAG: hypothetical protein ACH350_09760 [Parachlamydiaceae bacterium]